MALETATDVSSTRRIPLRADARALLRRIWAPGLLLVLVAGSLIIHARDLGHAFLAPWDEVTHAVVAEHIALHPLQPTLYEVAAIPPSDPNNWTLIHIWLHIPPFGLWAAAISLRVLGTTPLALRLPDLLFGLIGMIAIYLLGRRLYGRSMAGAATGLIAAAFVGFAPYPLLMSQGYIFGDITDIPLLALTPLAVLALVAGWQTGTGTQKQTSQRRLWLIGAGVLLGLCYLCKGALGIAPAGVAAALYLADWFVPPDVGWRRLGLRELAWFFGAALVVALPYNLYIARTYPADYARESGHWVVGFFHNYEGWGMPLDGHLTSWLYELYGQALALLLVAAVAVLGVLVVLAVMSLRRRQHSQQSLDLQRGLCVRADLVLVVWALTLYLPLTIAVSKAPAMTIGAVGALGLALGRLLTRGLSARALLARAGTVGLLLGAAATAAVTMTGHLRRTEMPYAALAPVAPWSVPTALTERLRPYAVEIALSSIAALAFLLLCIVVGAVSRGGRRWRARGLERGGVVPADALVGTQPATSRPAMAGLWAAAQHEGPVQRAGLACAVALAAVVLAAYWLGYDLQASSARAVSVNTPVPALGAYLEHELPANATVLIPSNNGAERVGYLDSQLGRLQLMFYAHRDVYSVNPVTTDAVCQIAAETAKVGSPLVVFTDAPFDGTVIGQTPGVDGWTLYAPHCG